MKKVLWLIVLFLLLVTFSDHPLIKPYKTKMTDMFSQSAENAGQVHGEQTLRNVRSRFKELSGSMGKGQMAELDRITVDAQTLLAFDLQYCVEKQFHALLFGDSLKQVCQIIETNKNGLMR
ncbi:MAG: hypothetical protein J0M22_05705 [Gammaproteobacteria bacterium]|jgi:hypothetical protein|nr:hypothetical protein [Gammaproteobacteria bacterium]